jgi:ribosomal protein S21
VPLPGLVLGAKESTVGVTFTSPVSGDLALKAFKKAVAGSKVVYKARAQQRWETKAERLKRKRLQRDFMNKIERNNEAYMKRFESPIEYDGVP